VSEQYIFVFTFPPHMTDTSFKCFASLLLIMACVSSLIMYFAKNIYWVHEQCGGT